MYPSILGRRHLRGERLTYSLDNSNTRIGHLLVKRNLLSQNQLSQALAYQAQNKVKLGQALTDLEFVSSSQISKILRRQKWLRILAGSIALAVPPSSLIAEERQSVKSAYSIDSLANTQDISLLAKPVESHSKEFYFTGDQDHLVSLNRDFKDIASIQFSLFNAKQPLFANHYEYQFEPQISLYSSESRRKSTPYSSTKRIGPGLDRQSNTKPVIYMLTLKGRCLYENSGNQTTMWSLERAKKGVQRKAELMFSITKHF